MSKYEDACKEWQEYILSLDLDQRKTKFCKYLEDAGVYELTAETEFYKSELNNMLIEGVTSLLHEKAQRAKNGTGKGIAHHRELSFAMSNKPDAGHVVHGYFWKMMSNHPTMKDQHDIPDTFGWKWLFSVPELVAGKPLLSEEVIPSLPPAPQMTNEKALKYSPDHRHTPNARDPSPDPFDIDHDHADRGIPDSEPIKAHRSYQSQLDEMLDAKRVSPDLTSLNVQPPGTALTAADGVEASPDPFGSTLDKEASSTPYDAAIVRFHCISLSLCVPVTKAHSDSNLISRLSVH